MTVVQQMTAADQFAELWKQLMPDYEVPPRQQFLVWAGTYSDELVSRGITRAAGKSRKMRDTATPMSADDCVRYAASVMRNELLGIRRHGTLPSTTNPNERGTFGR